jgi:hypothetical protein
MTTTTGAEAPQTAGTTVEAIASAASTSIGSDQHALAALLFSFHTWEAWKKSWDNQEFTGVNRIGLLHKGFEAEVDWSRGEYHERIRFYLAVASSSTGYNQFKEKLPSGGFSFDRREIAQKQQVAYKALQVLCTSFLKDDRSWDPCDKFITEMAECSLG